MKNIIAVFISGRKNNFGEPACIDCPVDKFCACDDADVLFDIDGVMRKKLIDVGQGVKLSEFLKVEKELLTGQDIYASLSHQGILAICVSSDQRSTIQFTDLNNNIQVKMSIEGDTLAAYYDNMILILTYRKPLREATVESVFNNPTVDTFDAIEGTLDVCAATDVSLLHVRRVLHYTSNDLLLSFNIDTRVYDDGIGRPGLCALASLTGIDSGFEYMYDSDTFTKSIRCMTCSEAEKDNDYYYHDMDAIFPSNSDPEDIDRAIFRFGRDLVQNREKIDIRHLIQLDWDRSIVRIYRDIFLAYDRKTESWVLLRVFVP